ncbi:hypothetical protein AD949_00115 [Acetobacter orleanensis]|nr:hypothetical protein AD949_00115 [Acetobacter orleanensis]PCD78211.1 hypothetical protein CO710_13535 [Acetobacter orleanensis]
MEIFLKVIIVQNYWMPLGVLFLRDMGIFLDAMNVLYTLSICLSRDFSAPISTSIILKISMKKLLLKNI